MDSFSFSKSLLSYMEQYEEIGMLRKRELIKGTLGISRSFNDYDALRDGTSGKERLKRRG